MDLAYCVKCKRKVAIGEAEEVTTKNGRKALKGRCSVCGTTVMRFVKSG